MRKDNNMEINFGASIDKSMRTLIRAANEATKNKPFQRGKVKKALERIKNAPFEKISLIKSGDEAKFEFKSKFYIHMSHKNPKTNEWFREVTEQESFDYFTSPMPSEPNSSLKLLKRLSYYLSSWDKDYILW